LTHSTFETSPHLLSKPVGKSILLRRLMTNILSNLRSPEWWFTVVVAGIIVDIVANTIRTLPRRELGRRRKSRRVGQVATLAVLRESPQKRAQLATAEMRSRFRGLVYLIEGMAIATVMFVLFSLEAPVWVTAPGVGMFAVLWYAFASESRFADDAARRLAEVRRETDSGS
jgi:hypothetical protein